MDGPGRLLVYELLLVTEAVRTLLRDNKLFQIPNIIQTGRQLGMVAMDQMIRDACDAGLITWETALWAASDPKALKRR